jgi:hypothetical protein
VLARGRHQVTCTDLAVEKLSLDALRNADLIAFHLPMHTATRLAVPVIEAARSVNPGAHMCCYGLYAPVNAGYVRLPGVETLVGGEFEDELRRLAQRLAAGDRSASAEPLMSFDRMRFETPDRSGLPPPKPVRHPVRWRDGSRRWIYGDEPWLQAPLPPLSRCACLQRDVPSGSG